MNNISFLQLVTQTHGEVKLYYDKVNSLAAININGQVWTGQTMDQCVSDIKQSFAIQYLQDKEFEQGQKQ